MKRILFNMMGLVAITAVLSACHPLNSTYDAIGPVPTPTGNPQTFSVTLTAADYGLLPTGNYAKTSFNFKVKDDAAASVPAILASKYPNYADKSSATVTYTLAPTTFKAADSLLTHVAYTLVNPTDYLRLPNNTFIDFNATQILTWLTIQYPTPAPNQLAVLTYLYFESGVTTTQTQSFIFLNGAWKKAYMISNAQYASVGKGGTSNDFAAADVPLLPSYFNTFLKADPAISSTAKFGDIQYVSYAYFIPKSGTTPAIIYQRVLPLTFDGTNWVNTGIPQTLSFVKTNGTWAADNTVTYSLVSNDYKYIATSVSTGATSSATDNLNSFGNFNIQGGATTWTDAQINLGLVGLLKNKYATTAVANQKFTLTYSAYNGANITVTKTFVYDGTNFNLVP